MLPGVRSVEHYHKPSLRVWFGAKTVGNPYTRLLDAHVRARGVDCHTTHPAGQILRDLLRLGAPDILHLHWLEEYFLPRRPPDRPTIARARAAFSLAVFRRLKRRGAKIVWTAHNLQNHEKRLLSVDRAMHRAVGQLADRVITHSESAKAVVIQTHGIEDPSRVVVVPHAHYIGVYPPAGRDRAEVRREYGVDDDGLLYLNFGRLRRYKNPGALIRAFCAAQLEGRAKLLLAGQPHTPDLAEELEAASRNAPNVLIDDRFIPDEEVTARFEAADVVVLSFEEILTSGSAVLAMSMGKPIIAPRLGTFSELLSHQDELLYDPGQLTAAIERAARTPKARLQQLGAQNLEAARAWDWPRVADETVRAYRSARQ